MIITRLCWNNKRFKLAYIVFVYNMISDIRNILYASYLTLYHLNLHYSYIHIYTQLHVHLHVYMHVPMHVHVHVHVYMHALLGVSKEA